jgi:hypothetical protein
VNNNNIVDINFHPHLDSTLLQWCLLQDSPLNFSNIAEAARDLFEQLDIKGNFNPTHGWVQKFLGRHPELTAVDQETIVEVINEDEYIIEELDECSQEETETFQDEEIIEEEVSESEAVNYLEGLLKFAQQRGNFDLENLLNECKSLMSDVVESVEMS